MIALHQQHVGVATDIHASYTVHRLLIVVEILAIGRGVELQQALQLLHIRKRAFEDLQHVPLVNILEEGLVMQSHFLRFAC